MSTNRKLEELLGLPRLDEVQRDLEADLEDIEMIDGDLDDEPQPTVQAVAPAMQTQSTAVASSPEGSALTALDITPMQVAQHEAEMEDIAKKALSTFDEMKDLAFSVEPKDAGSIFEPMVQMLKLGMDAKSSKLDRKMKLMRLKLDVERLEHQKASKPTEGFVEGEATGPGMLLDRNDLLAQLTGGDSKPDNK